MRALRRRHELPACAMSTISHLAQVGLPGHVGAGDDRMASLLLRAVSLGTAAALPREVLLHHRMPPLAYLDTVRVIHLRPAVGTRSRHLGQGRVTSSTARAREEVSRREA